MKPYFFYSFVFIISLACSSNQQHFELVLKGGHVNSGDGKNSAITDIGINADTITFIGFIQPDQADSIIDVAGFTVVPGFIDMHAHFAPIFTYPDYPHQSHS